jgi:hypothetical protein
VEVESVPGGHLGFPPASSVEQKLVAWLLKKARG